MLRGRSLDRQSGWWRCSAPQSGCRPRRRRSTTRSWPRLQFNFSNPGARSLALAGALTGAGDDATGAWTNPGGLTNITRPEVGVEFRGSTSRRRSSAAAASTAPDEHAAWTHVSALSIGNSNETTHSLSFVSAVVPNSRFAFAFYRTEVANFETTISTDGAFFDDPDDRHPVARLPVGRHAGGGDCQLRRVGRLPVDGPVLARRRPVVLRLRASRRTPSATAHPAPGRPPGTSRPAAAHRRQRRSDRGHRAARTRRAFGVNVGVSINPSDAFRIGASYRQGPKFDIAYRRSDFDGD